LPEAKILDLVLSFLFKDYDKKENQERPRKTSYLKDINGLTLVCKDFNHSIWRNHPTFVTLKAHHPTIRLLRKIPQLTELKVTIRATSIDADIQLFQRSLLLKVHANKSYENNEHNEHNEHIAYELFENLSDVLPNLRLLELTPTFADIDMRYDV
jgi:hypothetical protein